jgi:phosphoribosylanthranilate isomerase
VKPPRSSIRANAPAAGTTNQIPRAQGQRASVFVGAIQIAGVIDRAEADLLVACGVPWLGFPLRLAHHREDLTDAYAAAIVRSLPSHVRAVLITYLTRAEDVHRLASTLGVGAVQLHADVAPGEIERLRVLAPDLLVLKSLVVRPGGEAALERAARDLAPLVDAFLTDTFDPSTGATGATGRTHDWSVSARLVEVSPRPILLAGGLRPSNVAAAIALVRPAGVDAHTGVEGPDGRKRRDLVDAFVAEARRGFAVAGGDAGGTAARPVEHR